MSTTFVRTESKGGFVTIRVEGLQEKHCFTELPEMYVFPALENALLAAQRNSIGSYEVFDYSYELVFHRFGNRKYFVLFYGDIPCDCGSYDECEVLDQ